MTTAVDKKAVDEEYAKAQALVAQKEQEKIQQCAKEIDVVLMKYGMKIEAGQPILRPR